MEPLTDSDLYDARDWIINNKEYGNTSNSVKKFCDTLKKLIINYEVYLNGKIPYDKNLIFYEKKETAKIEKIDAYEYFKTFSKIDSIIFSNAFEYKNFWLELIDYHLFATPRIKVVTEYLNKLFWADLPLGVKMKTTITDTSTGNKRIRFFDSFIEVEKIYGYDEFIHMKINEITDNEEKTVFHPIYSFEGSGTPKQYKLTSLSRRLFRFEYDAYIKYDHEYSGEETFIINDEKLIEYIQIGNTYTIDYENFIFNYSLLEDGKFFPKQPIYQSIYEYLDKLESIGKLRLIDSIMNNLKNECIINNDISYYETLIKSFKSRNVEYISEYKYNIYAELALNHPDTIREIIKYADDIIKILLYKILYATIVLIPNLINDINLPTRHEYIGKRRNFVENKIKYNVCYNIKSIRVVVENLFFDIIPWTQGVSIKINNSDIWYTINWENFYALKNEVENYRTNAYRL